jgi:hypothetical protein
MCTTFWLEILKEKERWEDQGLGAMTILKWIVRKSGERVLDCTFVAWDQEGAVLL